MTTLLLLLLPFLSLSTASSSINSHSSSSSYSSTAVLFDQTPILTLTSTSKQPYICQPVSQCIPCSQFEIESSVCSIWGNKRKLLCQLYISPNSNSNSNSSSSRLNPLPILDPDAQQQQSPNSLSSTSTTKVEMEQQPSQYYEYEPNEGQQDDQAGSIKKIGYESSDGLDNVLLNEVKKGSNEEEEEEELRQVIEERRSFSFKGRKKRSKVEEELELVIRYFPQNQQQDLLEKRAGDTRRIIETFEACPKVVKREQSDYFEFVLCNLFFALSGLAVLMYRQRTLAGRQFGKLVARIMQTEIR
ncbi:hypothetical protein JCM3765_004994 [Sporobolomyces pararoseus]